MSAVLFFGGGRCADAKMLANIIKGVRKDPDIPVIHETSSGGKEEERLLPMVEHTPSLPRARRAPKLNPRAAQPEAL